MGIEPKYFIHGQCGEINPEQWWLKPPRKLGLGWPTDLGNYTKTADYGNKMVKLPICFLDINYDVAIWSNPFRIIQGNVPLFLSCSILKIVLKEAVGVFIRLVKRCNYDRDLQFCEE